MGLLISDSDDKLSHFKAQFFVRHIKNKNMVIICFQIKQFSSFSISLKKDLKKKLKQTVKKYNNICSNVRCDNGNPDRENKNNSNK